MFRKRHTRVAEKSGRLEDVAGHHGFEDVELVVALSATHRDRHIVAHHLSADHGHRFALGGVDLAWHDA